MAPKSSSKSEADGPDVYVGLLFASLAALISGCIFLSLELQKYGWKIAP